MDRWKVCDKRNEGKWQHGAVQSDIKKESDRGIKTQIKQSRMTLLKGLC